MMHQAMTNKKTFQASENISVEPVRPSQGAMYEIRLTKKGWRRVLKPEHCGTWGRPGTRNWSTLDHPDKAAMDQDSWSSLPYMG